jgi:hypothetical protein
MRSWFVVLALSVPLPGLAAPRLADPILDKTDACASIPRPVMEARLTISDGTFADASSVVKRMVEAAWVREGVRFDWQDGQPTGRPDLWIAVVRGRRTVDDVLGEAVVGDQAAFVVRVYLEGVEDWVRRAEERRFQTATLLRGLGNAAHLVPRAIGLVAAHEVGHVLLGTRQHASGGLMAGTYTDVHRLLTSATVLGLDAGNRQRLGLRLRQGVSCD